LNSADFRATSYIQSIPKMMTLLVEFATRQLKAAQDHLLILGQGSAEETGSFFLVTWHIRLATIKLSSPSLPLPMSREDIADLLGLTGEPYACHSPRTEGVLLTGLQQDLLGLHSPISNAAKSTALQPQSQFRFFSLLLQPQDMRL
jgi:CRP/FNR family transcriptional regulator